jgi:hypothetical protein
VACRRGCFWGTGEQRLQDPSYAGRRLVVVSPSLSTPFRRRLVALRMRSVAGKEKTHRRPATTTASATSRYGALSRPCYIATVQPALASPPSMARRRMVAVVAQRTKRS